MLGRERIGNYGLLLGGFRCDGRGLGTLPDHAGSQTGGKGVIHIAGRQAILRVQLPLNLPPAVATDLEERSVSVNYCSVPLRSPRSRKASPIALNSSATP